MKTSINLDSYLKHREIPKLFDMPVVVKVQEFTADSVDKFSNAIAAAHNTKQPVIPIVIDSYGGQIYSLLAMISEIENAHKPIATIAVGKAMSCGAILLGCGTPGYRFADPNATIMVHDVSSGHRGKIEEIKASVKESERLNKIIYKKLSKMCGYKDRDFFIKKITENKHADWFLSPLQAKRLNLIDHLGLPEFKISLDLNIVFKPT